MRILGIDPAMKNVGWSLLEYNYQTPYETQRTPDWISNGVHTYSNYKVLDGGYNIEDSEDDTWFTRIQNQGIFVKELVQRVKPDILVLESQLDKGANKSPTGLAIQNIIAMNYNNPKKTNFKSMYRDKNGIFVDCFIPQYVIFIRPERLQSIAHHARSTTGKIVVERYHKIFITQRKRTSHHECDGAFLAYHGGRFYSTVIKDELPRTILSDKESNVFLNSANPMISDTPNSWWVNDI
jgi:Holliday junction resolvasome RuvABC endonuclease subunit